VVGRGRSTPRASDSVRVITRGPDVAARAVPQPPTSASTISTAPILRTLSSVETSRDAGNHRCGWR
jgi:hypothetical protein